MNATQIITDAYGRCNRLSPGETLGADDLIRGLDMLNIIVDELSANAQFLFKSVFTSVAQTGNITTGAASWAAVLPGMQIFNAYADDCLLDYTTPARFAPLIEPTTSGLPYIWTYDGFNAVSLYPVPTGQTIKLETGTSVAEFADATTAYVVPPGYKAYLGARLAVRLHPVIAKLTASEIVELRLEERTAKMSVAGLDPAIIDACPQRSHGNILDGWR